MKFIANVETGEVIQREMTADEIKAEKAEQVETAAKEAEALEAEATKAANKAALLTKLGITDDEAKLLLS
jgi:hypothetical protein